MKMNFEDYFTDYYFLETSGTNLRIEDSWVDKDIL